jgi:hypothetical protein
MQFTSAKNMCFYCFIAIFLSLLFMISPLSNYLKISLFMKLVIIVILSYTFYLTIIQTNQLKIFYNNSSESHELTNQLNINIICSYVFTFFIGLLLIFVIKSLF